jgi:hypothetical protein
MSLSDDCLKFAKPQVFEAGQRMHQISFESERKDHRPQSLTIGNNICKMGQTETTDLGDVI